MFQAWSCSQECLNCWEFPGFVRCPVVVTSDDCALQRVLLGVPKDVSKNSA